jgi:hypothetical protein
MTIWLSILTVLSLAAGAGICVLLTSDERREGKAKRKALYRAVRGMPPRDTAVRKEVDSLANHTSRKLSS